MSLSLAEREGFESRSARAVQNRMGLASRCNNRISCGNAVVGGFSRHTQPKTKDTRWVSLSLAEREGFEPSCGFPQTDFESAPL